MSLRGMLAAAVAAVGGVLAFKRFSLREDVEWRDAEKPGTVVDIDGYGVHYVERGSGPAMVLVHGFGGMTANWDQMMPALARDYRVIAMDLKGFGLSERNKGAGYSHTDQVSMIKALLDRLTVSRAVFAGHSMGGAVVQRFAATYPEMVESLVLFASAAGNENRYSRFMLPRWMIRPLLPIFAKFTARALLNAGFRDKSVLTDEIRETYMLPTRIKGSMDGFFEITRDRRRDAPIEHARITCPVVLVNAAHDRLIPLMLARQIRGHIPQARLVVIENAAHMLIVERPDECVRAMRDFLKESAARGAAVSAAAS